MEPLELFDPNFNWRGLIAEGASTRQRVLEGVLEVLTAYGRHGVQRDSGVLVQPATYKRHQAVTEQARLQAAIALVRESPGSITPDMTPEFFATTTHYDPTTDFEPDTSYLDWVVQKLHTDEIEDRSEWDAAIQFVLMKEEGQIKYGHFAATSMSVRNYEWGAGMHIYRTWFETNKFGIKMSTLAPKFRFEYYDNIARQVYAALVAGITTAIGTVTNVVVTDLNTAFFELMRATHWDNNSSKLPWANANMRIIAAPEASVWLEPAMGVTLVNAQERLQKRFSVTYTPHLTDPDVLYVMVDKFEQNELGTRVPFGVFGSVTDIETFSDKTSYRGAWGFNLNPDSGRVLTFDRTLATFMIAPPIPVNQI